MISFTIDPSKELDDNLDVFNKPVQDINNCDDNVSDEYKANILLNDISDIYKKVKNAIKYGRETLTLDVIIDSLKSKERKMKAERNARKIGNIHQMRGRSYFESGEGQNDGSKKKGRNRSKSQGKAKERKYYSCGKLGHFISDCIKRKTS